MFVKLLIVQEFVLEVLIKELNNHSNKNNFLIDGYPRTMEEKADFEKLVRFYNPTQSVITPMFLDRRGQIKINGINRL